MARKPIEPSVRRNRRVQKEHGLPEPEAHFPSKQQKVNTQPLTAQTEAQKRYINAIRNFDLTVATGPAGTGKTYICASLAAEALLAGDVEKIIVTRPAVEAGESLGFLPGELEEKYAPFIEPFRSVLEERLGKSQVEMYLKNGIIEPRPLGYLRGTTFKKAFVILDEAQNTTPSGMKMFLTRIGKECTVVVNGDMEQSDLPGLSGLEDAIKRIAWIPQVKIIEFSDSDIVRSGLVGDIVSSYRNKP